MHFNALEDVIHLNLGSSCNSLIFKLVGTTNPTQVKVPFGTSFNPASWIRLESGNDRKNSSSACDASQTIALPNTPFIEASCIAICYTAAAFLPGVISTSLFKM